MKEYNEIRNLIKAHNRELREKYAVKRISIFGSYVRNEQTYSSDLDVLVEFEKSVSLLTLVSLENYLSDLTGVKVDVVPEEDIRPELREEIISDAVTI